MRSLLLLLALAPSLPALAAARPKAAALRPAEDVLSQQLATARREQIRSVAYGLELHFTAGKEEYSAKETIRLELADTSRALSLDWLGKEPASLTVNGEPVEKGSYSAQTGSLLIPARLLAKSTVIGLEFTNEFGKEGEGIQHVTDPEDKQEYVYTDFEPYSAHQLFPCFDQPDLKARFDLKVTAPAAWRAIGNELVKEESPGPADGEHTVTFRTTPLLSTYLFFVGAGPFEEWTDQEGKTPIVIYARKSLAKYVDAENLFRTMKKGLKFYREFFDLEYPFAKFGLVFAPEFGWGGMENPGAVVVNERNLFRGPVPATRRESRDDLILHEMAHHWFGDFVTMRWWNDLWLNESFATYMASLALEHAFQSKHVWQDFASSKSWGYWQDQLVTTHPIETKVPDTRTARGNFDGITYAKGGAALQQLHYFVGEDPFREGVRAYFRAHAFGNAERADFIGAIANAGRLDLTTWTRDWLQTAGVNRVSVKWACKGTGSRKVDRLTILQEKSSSGTLSPHKTRVGFFRADGERLQLLRAVDRAYAARSTMSFPEPTACPDFVFPNLDDKDYALFSLDPQSLASAELVLTGAVDDPLLRLQTWEVLAQMVRDGKLAPARYVELAGKGIERETDEGLLALLLGRHSPILSSYHDYLTPKQREGMAPALERAVLDRLGAAEKGSTPQMLFFDFFVRNAQTKESLDRIAGWLEKNAPPEGITLDQERRWMAVLALARHGYARAAELIAAEEKADPSDLGKREAYAARVALPKNEEKRAFWDALEHPEKIPPSTLREAAGQFNQANYPALTREYVKSFFARVRGVDWKKSDHLVRIYFEELFPGNLCDSALLAQSRRELRASAALTDLARRSWLEANDELARCVRVRKP